MNAILKSFLLGLAPLLFAPSMALGSNGILCQLALPGQLRNQGLILPESQLEHIAKRINNFRFDDGHSHNWRDSGSGGIAPLLGHNHKGNPNHADDLLAA